MDYRKGDRVTILINGQQGTVTGITPAPKLRTYLVTVRLAGGDYRDFLPEQLARAVA